MKLKLGPIVGVVSDREARIWLRADDPNAACVHVFRETGTVKRVTYPLPG